jgi:hypothetical protein
MKMKRTIFAVAFCLLMSTLMLGQSFEIGGTVTFFPGKPQLDEPLPGFLFAQRFPLCYCGSTVCTHVDYDFCQGGTPCLYGSGWVPNGNFTGTLKNSLSDNGDC